MPKLIDTEAKTSKISSNTAGTNLHAYSRNLIAEKNDDAAMTLIQEKLNLREKYK